MNSPHTALQFTAEHPALRGHFPGNPIVPAVLLLEAVLQRLESTPQLARGPPHTAEASFPWRIGSAKFHRPVRPGESLTLELQAHDDGSVGFTLSCGAALVAQGLLLPAAAAGPLG